MRKKYSFASDDICFCNSGKYYGDCHLVKRYSHPNEISSDQLKFFRWWPGCGVVEHELLCSESVINSHSLQKKIVLESIAEDHHVLTFSTNRYGRESFRNEPTSFVKASTKNASTFRGLCAKHDASLFKRIEIFPLRTNYQTAILLAHRSILFEALEHTKASIWLDWLSEVPKFDFFFDPTSYHDEAENMHFYASYNWELLRRINNVIDRKSVRKFSYVAVEFEGKPDFCATGCFCIELSFSGARLQDFSKSAKFNYAQLVAIPTSKISWVFILSALEDQNKLAARLFLESFLHQPRRMLGESALRATICHTENAYFRPSWIKSMSEKSKTELLARFDYGVDLEVGQVKEPASLSEPLDLKIGAKILNVFSNL